MRRAFPFLAKILILLLGFGRASAALGCVMTRSADHSTCPMAKGSMDADCLLSHSTAVPVCPQNCYSRTVPIAIVPNGTRVKPKVVAATPQMSDVPIAVFPSGSGLARSLPVIAASSPPRYILIRVFRI